MKWQVFFQLAIAASLSFAAAAQDSSIRQRIILMGDAGEINPGQQAIIRHAARNVLAGRTVTVYLGDNIYPRGMGLPGSQEEKTTQAILASQYAPLRSKGVPVYFIPGNHDWDRMGPRGYAKIVRQGEYLEELNDSLLRLVPANGCPGPVEIPVSDQVVIIAADSEWWLFPYGKAEHNNGCDCTNKDEVIAKMEELLYRNRYKVILFATHHPFQTYGPHGGYFNLRQHLFPFTAIHPYLYLPLPLIGSLYPLLRNAIPNPEDVGHPLYKDMINQFDALLKLYPNVLHVSGHEHTLQLINGAVTQVVSGGDSKHSPVKKGVHSLFAESGQGYVTADVLANRSVRLTYYHFQNDTVQPVFTWSKPFVDVQHQEEVVNHRPLPDSIQIAPYPRYNAVGGLHRKVFGENYRKEWATPATLPVLKLSTAKGGLEPTERGGGHQTKSLRLKDAEGKEWVLRTIQKNPVAALPVAFRQTFARDVAQDNISAAHPYASLSVPVLANAMGVPHANPAVVYVAPDKRLGIFAKDFTGCVCLLEQREPYGNTDNTAKLLKALQKDNDNRVDQPQFLRARLLDMYLADWDRHDDQWRWLPEKKGDDKVYRAIPRDRDQALYTNVGFLPNVASLKFIAPYLQGFRPKVKDVNHLLFFGSQLNDRFLNNLPYEQWMDITRQVAGSLTDSVLHAALLRMPREIDSIRHAALFATLRSRRDDLTRASDEYYRFFNKIVDVETSDKNEFVYLKDTTAGRLWVSIYKISKKGKTNDTLFNRVLDPAVTREIRLFLHNGEDSIVIDKSESPIRVRIVGGKDAKHYIVRSNGSAGVDVYEGLSNAQFSGNSGYLRKHLSNDPDNTETVLTNRYNKAIPLPVIGYNLDDGFMLGMGMRYVRQGFRKAPYASSQQFSFSYAFATSAFRIHYNGEWLKAIGKADIVLNADVRAPDNVTNFFGRGNETPFIKKPDNPIRFYRTRYTYITADPLVRWRAGSGRSSFSIGPSLQYYSLDTADNTGRFINNFSQIGSYDSSSISNRKTHLGIKFEYTLDSRNNTLLPSWGVYVNVKANAYTGLNSYAKSYAQLLPQVAFYTSLNTRATIVLANRTGGGISVGQPAFYQSMFLGGQDNLLGYRQYRFAGEQLFYNNTELRLKLADFATYLFPGQLGLLGFYDVGRVWQKGETSGKWHNGIGGGIYLSPVQLAVIRIMAGYSEEGILPYVALNFRF